MALSLSNTRKSQLKKILWITIAWTFISAFYFLNIYANILDLQLDISNLDIWIYLKGSLVAGVLAGTMGGTLMVLFWEKWLRTRNYGRSLFDIWWTYTVVYFLVGMPSELFVLSTQLNLPFYHRDIWQPMLFGILNLPTITNYLFWLIVVVGTLILLLVNDKYGPGVFRDFLLGKYFHPRREERIFMFLDLRSSTTIAEKLGESRYFNFLKDTFQHATTPILNTKGEIYQYVGDELVISWKMETGISRANCLSCFFEIQEALKDKGDYYMKTYDGLTPVFKAGLHYGYVMAGELGVVKREIAFSGDVMNTTARIQEKCNDLGVDLLLSGTLTNLLNKHNDSVDFKELGKMELRGKEDSVVLFTV